MKKSQNIIDAVEPALTYLQIAASRRQFWVRKTAHFLEFGLLGILWLWALRLYRARDRRVPLYALGLCFGTAAVDETIQIFTQRTAMLRDVWIDTAGAFTGICLFLLAAVLIRRLQK